MALAVEEIRRRFRDRYEGASVRLNAHPVGGIGGFIIWDGFAEDTVAARQEDVWNAISEWVDSADRGRMGMFWTFTPREIVRMSRDWPDLIPPLPDAPADEVVNAQPSARRRSTRSAPARKSEMAAAVSPKS